MAGRYGGLIRNPGPKAPTRQIQTTPCTACGFHFHHHANCNRNASTPKPAKAFLGRIDSDN